MREPKFIRDLARNRECTIRLPGCSHDKNTVVFAHLSGVRFNHGMGIKTNIGCFADHFCHSAVDTKMNIEGMSNLEVKLAFYEGIFETMQILMDEGRLVYV